MIKGFMVKDWCIIAAVAENGVIGYEGFLPWVLMEDLRFFKQITTENDVVMGLTTYLSLGKPLPKRMNIVISRYFDDELKNVKFIRSIKQIEKARRPDRKLFIIGGSMLYKSTILYCKTLMITHVKGIFKGDKFFPKFKTLFDEEKVIQENDQFIIKQYINKNA